MDTRIQIMTEKVMAGKAWFETTPVEYDRADVFLPHIAMSAKRVKEYIGKDTFFLTYGDGVSDVNILETLRFHRSHGKLATITAIQPEGRFGYIDLNGDEVLSFREKSEHDTGWINAGFMVLEPAVLDFIKNDTSVFEREPMETIAKEGQMVCYKHTGFWQCMDTLRDKEKLEKMWSEGKAPWKYGD